MATSCRYFFCLNTTKKESNGNKLPSPSSLPSHFWFLLLPFCFKHFLLASFSSEIEKKKKTINKKKNVEKG